MSCDVEPLEAVHGVSPDTSKCRRKLFRGIGWAVFAVLPVIAFSYLAHGTSTGHALLLWLVAFSVFFALLTALTLAGVILGLMLWRKHRYPKSIALHAIIFLASVWIWWLASRTDVVLWPNWKVFNCKTHFDWFGRIQIPKGLTSDEPLIPFDQARRFFTQTWGHRAGFCDRTGRVVVPAKYESADLFHEGRAVIHTLDGKHGVVDNEGRVVAEPIYDALGMRYDEGLLPVRMNGKWGFLDLDGMIAIAPEYDLVRLFHDGRAVVNVGGKGISKRGLLDTTTYFGGGRWGFIDRTGNVVIPLQFLDADPFSESKARVTLEDGTQWFIDRSGQLIDPYVDPTNGNFFR